MLDRFFAVTTSDSSVSLYRVSAGTDEKPYPHMEKLLVRGSSQFAVGVFIPEGKTPYTVIEIGKTLTPVDPQGLRDPEISELGKRVPLGFRSTVHTSRIVGLFLEEGMAHHCFSVLDVVPCDFRWILQTREVHDEIGEGHKAFFICREAGFMLLDPEVIARERARDRRRQGLVDNHMNP